MENETYLIRRDEVAAMTGLEKTHFLNEKSQRLNKSLGDAAGLTGIGFHIIEVQPGFQTTEHHLHHYEDEAVFVLEGTATAMIGDQSYPIGPGDFIGYRKGGLPHSIRNDGATTLRCIVVGERRAHDVCDYPNLGKRIYRNDGLPWELVEMAAITTLGGKVGKK